MKYTNEIFWRLAKGQFISSNSIDAVQRACFNDIEENQEDYANYYQQIGFQLCGGDGFYYFSRNEPKNTIENKIRVLSVWIDYVDFFMTYDPSFAPGTQFTLANIEVRLNSDVELKKKLDDLPLEKTKLRDKVAELVGKLVGQGFAEEINETTEMFQVTTAYRYITDLIETIPIKEEAKDALSE